MATATKPRPKPKPKQRTLFDAAVPAPLAKWKQPRHDKAADPTWQWTWLVPPIENLELRRAALGW